MPAAMAIPSYKISTMRKTIILSGFLFSFLMAHSQQPFPQTSLKKLPTRTDSLHLNTERQNLLSTHLNTANKERKKILLFPASTRNTKNQDAAYIGQLQKKEIYKVNLSGIVSKYYPETEKNLEQ